MGTCGPVRDLTPQYSSNQEITPMAQKNASGASLLLVDDDRHLLDSMARWLREQGFQVDAADSLAQAEQCLAQRAFDLVITDIRLHDRDGFELLAQCREKHPNMAVILITGYGTVDTAVDALRAGAFDLLTKPLIDDELLVAINRALSQNRVAEENRELRAKLDLRFGMEAIVGFDSHMQHIAQMIDSVADTRATVLITGESGTGKSLIARAIHRRSSRREKPFVEVACGALPDTLLESELFGHVRGAFTGATGDKIGKFKQADGGTIFLDEIATASPSMQVKLLRVLQDLEFEQVGGTRTFRVDTRAILATNENLATAVAEGRFREDLYYRINVINIELPPLRERISDIPVLARHFLSTVCRESGKQIADFTADAMALLQGYRWPGNVRELQNVVARAVLLGRHSEIGVQDLPQGIAAAVPLHIPKPEGKSLKEALEGPERQIILACLEQHDWNRNATADALGINRTTLYKKMKRLGLDDHPRAQGSDGPAPLPHLSTSPIATPAEAAPGH